MPTEAKRETVAGLTEEARGSTAMIVSEYRGLRVSELGEIRRSLRKQNVTYRVVKNRLMKIAARDAGAETLGLLLEGPTAVAFARGDEAAAARAVLDAVRPYRLVKITGAVLGTRVIDAGGVVRLSRTAQPGRRPGPGRRRDLRATGHDGRPVRRPVARDRWPGASPRRQARRLIRAVSSQIRPEPCGPRPTRSN